MGAHAIGGHAYVSVRSILTPHNARKCRAEKCTKAKPDAPRGARTHDHKITSQIPVWQCVRVLRSTN
jgi:hypothetical protein